MALIYEDKTGILRRALFDVQNEVGLGRGEEDYHQACRIWLEEIPISSKAPHPLTLYGHVADVLYPDFVAWDCITVELKSIPRAIGQSEVVQLFNYLKCRNDRVGLLANLGLTRVQIERFVYKPAETKLVEDWRFWEGHIDGRDRDIGLSVREALRDIYAAHSTGYGQVVVKELLLFALRWRRHHVVESPIAASRFRGIELRKSPLDCLLVDDRIVVAFTALFDDNNFNINRGRSFLKALNLSWGIAANFGKTQAEITGLHNSS